MSTETTPNKKEPTASEAMFFFAIVKHTRNKADIDWQAVAEEQKFKNAEVAKVRFGQVKRKLGISSDATSSSTPRITPASTPKKKSTSSTAGTPTRVAKSTGGRVGTKGKGRSKVKKEEMQAGLDGNDDDTVARSSAIKGEARDYDHGIAFEMDSIIHDEPF